MGIKLRIYLIIVAVIAALGTGGYFYYHWSQEKINGLEQTVTTLKSAVATQQNTIKSMKRDSALLQENLNTINEQFRQARKENDDLVAKLSRHNLGYLATQKPKLVQDIINKGTADSGRCFEILSGSPLTAKEKAATKKSQVNSMCADIANPNYKAKQ